MYSGIYSISPTVSPTGKYTRRPDPQYGQKGTGLDMKDEDDQMALWKACARGESLKKKSKPIDKRTYTPLLHHPLPPSENKSQREYNLRRIMYTHIDQQVISAVVLNDGWVVEELFMRGAPCDVKDRNGFTPLHIAAEVRFFWLFCHIFAGVSLILILFFTSYFYLFLLTFYPLFPPPFVTHQHNI